ncbi:hypothetical protein Rhe02_35600 [Rhizocola hellebori]|uniref:Uncharacterized protein n=1 Tax=Rhizocola hellebori TaxID=1392758 RepID=A0A8J3Q7F0_9ACTN|nr:hypothetical protein [Rhizocola hellebori]GIH05493.1 hypothetical protein Rhe02_35600 [Rhizocola hellebori]
MQEERALGIVVIRSDDTRAHLFRDMEQLLRSSAPGATGNPGAVEFFSTAGHRLAPVFGPNWRLLDLVETNDKAQPEVVLHRLRATVRHMRSDLRANLEAVESAGLNVDDGLARLPSMQGASLEAALEAWAQVLGHFLGSHSADPWHNFWVHGIF